jgi:cytochrome c553
LPNGSYDVKIVLGEADVREDGSAIFKVPARTPVYFQAIDRNGQVAQTMRSWVTLQPGEAMSCVGCHESKYEVPSPAKTALAAQTAPQDLRPFYGPPRPFGFRNEIQPILDRHCVRCHDGDRAGSSLETKNDKAFSLRGDEAVVLPSAKRKFSASYVYFTSAGKPADKPFQVDGFGPNPLVNWMNVQEVPTPLPPYHAGSAKSKLMAMLRDGHKDVRLSREDLDKIACWIDLLVPYCSDYTESNTWTPQELAAYEKRVQKRRDMEAVERQNIREYTEQRQ